MEGVGVFHHEFSSPHHAKARADLIAELGLNLVKVQGQLLVTAQFPADEVRDDLFVGWANAEGALVPVLHAQKLGAVVPPAATLFPQLRGLHRRHQYLSGATVVHLIPNQRFDFSQYAKSRGQPGIDAGGDAANEAGAKHETVGDDFRVRGHLFERAQKQGGRFHSMIPER